MHKPLKIAMLGHKRIPSREGGIEIVVEELSNRLVNLNNHVTVFNRSGNHVSGKAYNKPKSLPERVVIKNIFTLNVKGLAALTSSFFASILIAFSDFDVVHYHAEGPCAMMWIPKIFGKKCIATIHGLDHKRAKWGKFASWYIRLGEKIAVKYADHIIVLSDSMKQYFLDNYNRRTEYIPNGISPQIHRDSIIIKERFGLTKNSYILYLGRIVPEKGIDYLVEAYKSIRPSIKLVIAGGSSDSDQYMSKLFANCKDNENIIFTGFVQGELLTELYSNAYIYVLPSDVEGMPISLLEAMCFGNCCLTSDIKECSSVVADHGLCFQHGNVTDLAEKLNFLCLNEDIVEKYKLNSSEYVLQKYNWDDVVSKTLYLYEH